MVGGANAELVALVADRLDVPAAAVRVSSGATSRRKSVAVDGVTVEAALGRLASAQRY